MIRRLLACKRFCLEEDGQDLVEYAFLLGFIVMTSLVTLGAVGGAVKNLFWGSVTSALLK